jgi:peptidoglycan/LPS O-acetylase OafA/YrhL
VIGILISPNYGIIRGLMRDPNGREFLKMHGTKLVYRPDIDGLRAIAVILVLLFHFNLGVPGGFIGVDVFFVISGYLITEVIKVGCSSGKFSFVEFYARRLIRLHPALITTATICMGAGYIIMDPASLSSLASSAQYAVFASSNVFFWLNSGYFDASAHTQPLLHTWSLAAEWQFYLVWPFVVWASLKVSERFLAFLLAVIAITSLAASQYMLTVDATASYFLMPFRVFELASGALMVYATRARVGEKLESLLLALGIALIAASAFMLDSASPFPGLAALPPCIGATLCIYAGRSTLGGVLRTGPMVWIGVISYSLYLVHWPILVFYKYFVFREITLAESIGLLIASIAAGWAMYALIERRLMPGKVKSNAARYTASVAMTAAVFAVSWSIVASGGYSQRINAEYAEAVSNPADFRTKNYGGYGFKSDGVIGKKEGVDAYLLGDSFSLQYASGLDKALALSGIALQTLSSNGCFISSTYTRLQDNRPRPDCLDRYARSMRLMANDRKPLLFALHWTGYRDKTARASGELINLQDDDKFAEFLAENLQTLRKDVGDRPLIIIGSQPFLSSIKSISECLLRPNFIHQPCIDSMRYKVSQAEAFKTNEALKKVVSGMPNTFFLDPSVSLCKEGFCGPTIEGKLIYSDNTHLSLDGSEIAARQIAKLLDSIIKG